MSGTGADVLGKEGGDGENAPFLTKEVSFSEYALFPSPLSVEPVDFRGLYNTDAGKARKKSSPKSGSHPLRGCVFWSDPASESFSTGCYAPLGAPR
ncbi:hypothetical protein JCM15519_23220 [Fundidesulfovibrio butyratiphilus]